MRTVLAISTAWLTATLVAVVIAAAAVGNVRTQVTDGPTALGPPTTIEVDEAAEAAPLQNEAPDLQVDDEPPVELPGPDEVTTTTVEVIVETTTTTSTQATTQTTTPTTTENDHSSESTTTSTTQPPPTTSTTVAAYTKTYNVTVDGVTAGTVRIAVSGETVSFSGATVSPGWKFTLDEGGPDKVKVEFELLEDDDIRFEFQAKVDDGELEVEISDND